MIGDYIDNEEYRILQDKLAEEEKETLKIGEFYNQALIREEDLKEELSESKAHLDMIHSILSGGGLLGYRVDKAIRKIEQWKA